MRLSLIKKPNSYAKIMSILSEKLIKNEINLKIEL